MRSPRLAALELRRFGRGKLPRAALVAILLLPLLYGALYLWSFWDPYGRLDKLPVALVNEDKGAKTGGEKLNAGDEITRNLRDSKVFEWHEVSDEEAREGVEEGRYYLSLTMPKDFSERIASSSGDSPETGALRVRTNDSNNYIVGQISRTVFSEIRTAASTKSSRSFLDRIFISFSDIHDATEKAAQGADDLKNGTEKAKKGSKDLSDGLTDAKKGSGELAGGITRLTSGAAELTSGSRQVADGTQLLADRVNRAAGEARPYLKDNGAQIGRSAQMVADFSQGLRNNLDLIVKWGPTGRENAHKASDDLNTVYRELCVDKTLLGKAKAITGGTGTGKTPGADGPSATAGTGESAGTGGQLPEVPGVPVTEGLTQADVDAQVCPKLAKAKTAAADTARVADDVHELAKDSNGDIGKLDAQLKDVQTKAQALARRAPHLDEDLAYAVTKVNELNDGARKVADGAGALYGGLATAKSGSADLDSGVGRLKQGAGDLDSGMFRLVDGSTELAGGLNDGVGKIPDYGKDERDRRTEVMADPVKLASQSLYKAPNYGTGFAPYFIPLSLWVGAMVAYMLIQPLNRRALAAGAAAWRIALAGWLPVAAIGLVQVAALMSVLHWGLGLEMARSAATMGFLALVTCCFAAIIQWLNARFGAAGRILVLALLMLQLTSAGGTYPVQTSPGFFNAIHPWLPMTYVVEALRRLISGGGMEPVWTASAVLAAFTAGALALTAISAHRRQVWTLDKLHPELSL
ncbi:YhgE/Pip domain-containing protein [Streptomyces lichenis]|uniref:YhgE/Pip domain-containing protein n=1 Tax=Streptomyces lichenis TaxID=2306967 RepID=A0ABT0IGI1_9ACTN|nr:YhgE/Pip domain-containing protein [Streptomyces lichenis]MCK8680424.1 YhgE/Pip domain-containing protein [Streptomyces lichenis]